MPTKVHNPPKNEIPGHAPDVLREHELTNVNKNLQHKEALRLALGSILTPKRPYSPPSRSQSRSSSGTASPALSFPFPSTSPSPPSTGASPPPAHPTPTHGHSHGWLAESHMHSLYMHPHLHHSHPHTPSRLGITDSSPTDHPLPHSQLTTASTSPAASSPNSPLILPNAAMPHSHEVFPRLLDAAPELPSSDGMVPTVHGPAPVQAMGPESHVVTGYCAHREAHDKASGTFNGSGTPKAKFIETLQSKSAWDALIHGSFS